MSVQESGKSASDIDVLLFCAATKDVLCLSTGMTCSGCSMRTHSEHGTRLSTGSAVCALAFPSGPGRTVLAGEINTLLLQG